MFIYNVKIEGTGWGLLMHRFGPDATVSITAKVKSTSNANKIGSPEEEAEKVVFRMDPKEGQEKGQLYISSEHLYASIVKAGSALKVKGNAKKTYKSILAGAVEIMPKQIPIKDSEENPIFEYVVDSRSVVIRATKGRIMRHRPNVPAGWKADFQVITDIEIPDEVLQQAVSDAGTVNGIGDYRPRFGKFLIINFKRAE